MTRSVCGSLLLSAAALFAPVFAQAQVKPRIVIAFDTSGSMAQDLDGVPTFGDGVTSGCSGAGTNSSPYCGANCTAGVDTNCDGETNDSRIYIAKNAVANMISAFGDVDWALARFSQDQGTNRQCLDIGDRECSPFGNFVTSFGNPQCNSGGTDSCSNFWETLIPNACRPGNGGRPGFEFRTGGNPLVCINYEGQCSHGSPARGGDILVGFSDLGPFAGLDNTLGIYSWLNTTETNFVNSTTRGNYCNSASNGDCELRPDGSTPLAGILNEAGSYLATVQSTDPAPAGCRPYSVILLTDGEETCGGNPSSAAGSLLSSGINTYVVGLAISTGSRTALNAIATAGGTDAGASGGDTAFFADNQTQLAAGLAQIVADSLLSETCNGMDDDCDTFIDEGVLNACGTCGAVPVETCNGMDDDCDGIVDDGVLNACGTCGPPPTEICNGIDDDCDGVVDENNVCAGCTPTAEICDGIDNNCNGAIDENLMRPCGSSVGLCTVGNQTCSAGTWGTCSGTGPTAEVCDGDDNDCDGIIDGITRPCGSSVGECIPGAQICTAGGWGACTGAVGPTTEICDGLDNNCMNGADEGNPGGGGTCGTNIGECSPGTRTCTGGMLTCAGGTGPTAEVCDGDDNDCDGATDEGVPTMGACGPSTGECRPGVNTCVGGAYTCVGAVGPATEVCDGRDNNCNGSTDEGNPGGGASCGSATGLCTPGTSVCTGGMLTCSGGTGPATETCDNRDEDCDGLVDEGNPGGGPACGMTAVGECSLGALACMSGGLICVGATDPSAEVCDGLDNDCDGSIDEMNPEGGAACGDSTGECTPGTTLCMGGTLICDGGSGPVMEICDGLDNDCDGVEDEGLGVGAPCGSDIGECSPGVNICELGGLVCTGEIGPRTEECNLLDDDCDGAIDELSLGGSCGSDEGLCMAGMEQCIDGALVCMGAVDPTTEGCDCSDNDCDGAVDEGDSLCPSGTACRDCGCADPCVMSEFGFTCPTGTTPEVDGAECYCVAPRCNAEECAAETVERDGEALCAPDATGIANCVCRNNECTFSCDGVVCAAGLRCDPRDPLGRCVEDTCRGLGCPEGEVCNRVTTECEADACADVTCGSGEACRDGVCEGSCATVMCAVGETCTAGVCGADPCADVACPVGQYCDDTGACAEDLCVAVNCPAGTICTSATGDCVEDPCTRLDCPDGEICEEGECTMVIVTPDAGVDAGPVDAGADTGSGGEDPFTRVLATGGGGCTCSVPGAEPSSSDDSRTGALAFAFGLFGLVFWRRRRLGAAGRGAGLGKAALVAIAALVALFGSGCDVDPYCLDCVDGAADASPDTGVDTGIVRPDTGTADTGAEDAGTDTGVDGCVPGAPELCNEFDDDCDGMVDEGVDTDTDTNNCGACGNRCAPDNAFPECVAGACQFATCRTGYYDLDGDSSNGCEYRCSTLDPAADDSLCDLRDNDCDGVVDEDVAFDSDPLNCGTCGTVCRFAHAAGACTAGACDLGACDADFWDIDGAPGNGCEYSCTQAVPATEVCNGVDDDCDGAVDQGNPEGGAVCGRATGECSVGVERCVGGDIVCFGEVAPTTEVCNGLDDDCDGAIDQGDPEGGRLCGNSVGACTQGREVCTGGALVCTGGITATTETCNGLDDDCDGSIDEMNPGGGGACGPGTGACMPGIFNCRGGVLVCEGAVGSTPETCNNADDDCDGMVDENNPGGGGSCGSDIGACVPGSQTCMGGSLVCVGATGPGTETCNGIDDDCSGAIDEGNPGGGAACGNTTGACTAGMEVCTAGALVCTGGTGPTLETCNGIDDDCDGTPDQFFDLMNDINNCGSCGNVCSFPNATAGCVSGSCVVLGCDDGWVDLDAAPGCDYACNFNGTEVCNGLDDDCDGTTDIGVSPPAFFCNPNGVCAGTTASCGGASGWECNYPAAYEETEVSCDGSDNDCNGIVDDTFNIGAACSVGQGRCRGTGTVQCTSTTTAACNATPAATALPNELCNAIDDDCDGTTDEAIPLSSIPTVEIAAAGGGTVRVMQYEASRPDADASDPGGIGDMMACSNPDVLPWTTVTWNQARAACQALNNGVMSGWDLCDEADWESACEGPGGPTCDWSYSVACTSSTPTRCNGEEFDSSGAAGDQDALYATASTQFGMCFTDWDAAGVIYDLSGNVKEWTRTAAGAGNHIVRGGSYNNIEPGRTCTFDWTVAPNSFAFPNTGFRCCNY